MGAGYAVFGMVLEGMDVVDKITAVSTGVRGQFEDVPNTPVVIKSARVVAARRRPRPGRCLSPDDSRGCLVFLVNHPTWATLPPCVQGPGGSDVTRVPGIHFREATGQAAQIGSFTRKIRRPRE